MRSPLALWRTFKAKFFTDRADSILVPALILAPVMALAVGLAVEVTKNNYVRNDRINSIQDAAVSAASTANSRGSLSWEVLDSVVNEYEHQRFGQKVFSGADNGDLTYDGGKGQETLTDMFGGRESACLVNEDDGTKYPYYTVTLKEGRAEDAKTSSSRTISFSRTQPTVANANLKSQLDPSKIYRSVEVKIVDSTPNIIMGMMGASCQNFSLSASSVTFAVNSDL